MDDNLINWLQNWYYSNCDGDWEYQYGITIDNPGWRLSIDLEGTEMEDIIFQTFEIEKSENDWDSLQSRKKTL